VFLRLSTAKLLDEYMAENAGNSISEVQILKFSRGSIVTGHSYTVPPPFSSTLLYPPAYVLGFGAVIHFL
jgi:hypothetical protein